MTVGPTKVIPTAGNTPYILKDDKTSLDRVKPLSAPAMADSFRLFLIWLALASLFLFQLNSGKLLFIAGKGCGFSKQIHTVESLPDGYLGGDPQYECVYVKSQDAAENYLARKKEAMAGEQRGDKLRNANVDV